jgi:hypothetical protein
MPLNSLCRGLPGALQCIGALVHFYLVLRHKCDCLITQYYEFVIQLNIPLLSCSFPHELALDQQDFEEIYHCFLPLLQIGWKAGRDVWWHEVMADARDTCEPEWMDAEDPLFMLYTR